MDKYTNGSQWTNGETVMVLQQLTEGLFCLLEFQSGANALVIDPVHSGKWQYAAEELPDRLKDWVPNTKPVDPAEQVRAEKAEKEQEVTKTVKKKVKSGKV